MEDTHNGSGHTGDQTTTQVDGGQLATDQLVLRLAGGGNDLLLGNFEHGELGHGVRNLLEQDGTETGVETGDTFLSGDSGETTGQAVGEGWLRNQSDSSGFQGAQGDVGEEFGDTGGTEVDGLSVLSGRVDTDGVNGDLLPELVTGQREKCELFVIVKPTTPRRTLRTSRHPGWRNRGR
jgi:hypothetical protein